MDSISGFDPEGWGSSPHIPVQVHGVMDLAYNSSKVVMGVRLPLDLFKNS